MLSNYQNNNLTNDISRIFIHWILTMVTLITVTQIWHLIKHLGLLLGANAEDVPLHIGVMLGGVLVRNINATVIEREVAGKGSLFWRKLYKTSLGDSTVVWCLERR